MASVTPPSRLHRTLSNPALQRASGPPGRLEQDRGGGSRGRRRGDPQPRADPEPAALPHVGQSATGISRRAPDHQANSVTRSPAGCSDGRGCCRLGVLAASRAARMGAGMSAAPRLQAGEEAGADLEGPEPIGSWKTTMPPKIAARLAATEVIMDDLDGLADLEAAGRGVEGDHPGDRRGQRPRLSNPSNGPGAAWVSRPGATSETPNAPRRPRRGAALDARSTWRRVETSPARRRAQRSRPRRRSARSARRAPGRWRRRLVSPMTTNPAAVIVTPTHCRRQGESRRSARRTRRGRRARWTAPPARSTAAQARAHRRANPRPRPPRSSRPRTTWSEQSRRRCAAVKTSIGGATTAPRCLNRKARFVATAEASASSPKITARLDPVCCRHGRVAKAWLILRFKWLRSDRSSGFRSRVRLFRRCSQV